MILIVERFKAKDIATLDRRHFYVVRPQHARTRDVPHLVSFYGDGVGSDVADSYTVIFEEVGDGWVQARLSELPGVITAAPSCGQAAQDVVDALREYLLSPRDN